MECLHRRQRSTLIILIGWKRKIKNTCSGKKKNPGKCEMQSRYEIWATIQSREFSEYRSVNSFRRAAQSTCEYRAVYVGFLSFVSVCTRFSASWLSSEFAICNYSRAFIASDLRREKKRVDLGLLGGASGGVVQFAHLESQPWLQPLAGFVRPTMHTAAPTFSCMKPYTYIIHFWYSRIISF